MMQRVEAIYFSKVFWMVAFIVALALPAALSAPLPSSIPVDRLLVFQALAVAIAMGLAFFQRSLQSTHYAYLVLQMLFVWIGADTNIFGRVGFSFKPHILAVLFAILMTLIYLVRDFGYFWRFMLFRCIFLFFIANVFYFLFYHTGFVVSSVSAGYPLGKGMVSEFSEADARSIIFVGSLSTLISVVCGLAVFKEDTQRTVAVGLERLITVMSALTAFYFLIAIISGFKSGVPGGGLISGLMFFMLLSFYLWVLRERPDLSLGKIPMKTFLPLTLGINLAFLLVGMNKTMLIGLLVTSGILLTLHQLYGVRLNVGQAISLHLKKTEGKLVVVAVLVGLVAILTLLGTSDVIAAKLDYFSRGFSTLSTLDVRTGNWRYFGQEWLETLDIFKLLFGYGTGQSRETIFYISAMRQSGTITLVQTLHNTYMEFFYDYGLLALVYYAGIIHIVYTSVRDLLSGERALMVRTVSIMSLCLILFIGIYGLMDGLRVQTLIVFFSALAMAEGLKRAYAVSEPFVREVPPLESPA